MGIIPQELYITGKSKVTPVVLGVRQASERMSWEENLMVWGHKSHSIGMDRSQGMWMGLGELGAQTCGHWGGTGNLNITIYPGLPFSHSDLYCMTAPTVPFSKSVLSFQGKQSKLFCPTEVLSFHPLCRSGCLIVR